jgi:hypothetical protein
MPQLARAAQTRKQDVVAAELGRKTEAGARLMSDLDDSDMTQIGFRREEEEKRGLKKPPNSPSRRRFR